MKTFSLLTVGLLSTAVVADPNGHHKHGPKQFDECMELLDLERAQAKSNNTKLMDRLEKNHPNGAAMIKSKSQGAQSRITQIEGNSKHPADWLANCHVKGAEMHLRHQCMERDFLPKILKSWNDKNNASKIQKEHNWNDAQFTEEKGVLETKLKGLGDNKTLDELCVTLPKPHKGGKGDKGPDGKDGGKPDGKGDKGKGPDGKPAANQKNAASGFNGAEAVRGGAFALALTLLMAVTIL